MTYCATSSGARKQTATAACCRAGTQTGAEPAVRHVTHVPLTHGCILACKQYSSGTSSSGKSAAFRLLSSSCKILIKARCTVTSCRTVTVRRVCLQKAEKPSANVVAGPGIADAPNMVWVEYNSHGKGAVLQPLMQMRWQRGRGKLAVEQVRLLVPSLPAREEGNNYTACKQTPCQACSRAMPGQAHEVQPRLLQCRVVGVFQLAKHASKQAMQMSKPCK